MITYINNAYHIKPYTSNVKKYFFGVFKSGVFSATFTTFFEYWSKTKF